MKMGAGSSNGLGLRNKRDKKVPERKSNLAQGLFLLVFFLIQIPVVHPHFDVLIVISEATAVDR